MPQEKETEPNQATAWRFAILQLEMFLILLKAILVGIIVTAPVGPVGALVIRRSLKSGFLLGLSTGLGAALADSLFAIVAGLGLAPVESFLSRHDTVISVVGGVVLTVLGLRGLYGHVKSQSQKNSKSADTCATAVLDQPELLAEEKMLAQHKGGVWAQRLRAAAGSFLITVSNPVTILGFASVFVAFGFHPEAGMGRIELVGLVFLGVFLGAALWWGSLSLLFTWMRGRMSDHWAYQVTKVTHIIILVSGILCFFRAWY